ncbi:integrase/recombinase XerC [Curtobacterium sp. PhB25]|uniref:tyrosine-type recombinase/integrase n=1 Tax=Curtobacterium sp. PhB25 TaxID=2485205 RepID=UPI0010CEC66E|nr:tyrosine-type recombinase/integrase [Curtobacterium sp. PhB25]TDW64748.1 integrase/recombinase XerC [Curtobacterium sp. PhB25]
MNAYELDMTRQRLGERTIEMRLYWARRLLDFGTDPLTATTDDLHGYLEAHTDWSTGTLHVVVASLHSLFRWLVRAGHRADDPSAPIYPPREERTRARIADDSTIASALAEATVEDRAILLLGAEGGLRCSEIAGLRRTDRDGEWLDVLGKGRKLRPIHLSPECRELLDNIEATTMRHGFYFPSTVHAGRPLTANTVWRRVNRLTGYNTHALRHRAGTTVYRNSGHDLRLTQEFLGHASPTTTAIYVHIERDDMRRASEASRMAA